MNYPSDDASIRWAARWSPLLFHPSVIFRKSHVKAAGNYRDVAVEDLDLWQRLSLYTEFHNLAEPLIQYRRTTSSLTGTVTDYFPMNRSQAHLNSSILFPGITNAARALDLWYATYPSRLHVRCKYWHISALEGAAITFARRVGKPGDYFLNTDLYCEQRFRLRRGFFDRIGLTPLVKLRDRFHALSHN
jgi:hypothetical protein